jgi:hypothetical protein
MNQSKSKLFRPLFPSKAAFRKFKHAYSSTSKDKRLETIIKAHEIRAKGVIKHMEISQ